MTEISHKPIPRMQELPLIGSLLPFHSKRLEFFWELARDNAPLRAFRLGPIEAVFINSPQMLTSVLIDNADDFTMGVIGDSLMPIIGPNSLLLLTGGKHRKQRKLAVPAFHHRRLASYVEPMVQFTQQQMQEWGNGAELDVEHEMVRLTLRIVGKVLLNEEHLSVATNFGSAMYEGIQYAAYLSTALVPLPLSWPTLRNWRTRRALNTIHSMVDAFVQRRRRDAKDYGDLFSMFMFARDENGEGLSDEELHDQVLTIVLGGHETSSTVLSWCVRLLMQNPEIYTRLRKEIDEALQGRPFTWDDMPRLAYVQQFIKETLRLYPPSYLLSRQAKTDVSLGDYLMREGTLVIFSPYVIHRNPEVFPDPERCDPDRFAPAKEKQLPRLSYIPFSTGPHTCIGNNFALLKMQAILITLLQRFDFDVVPGHEGQPEAALTIKSTGLRARVRRRE